MENNNLNEQIKENTAPESEASEKKPLPWWVFAAIGAGVVVIIAVVLIIVLAGGCKAHVDADDDLKCDLCGKTFDDGDDLLPPTSTEISFSVVDGEGNAMSGVSFELVGSESSFSVTTDASGFANQEIAFGKYNISYDYSTFPSGFMPDISTLSVSSDSTAVTITIIDNNPNGSAARPYFISDNITVLTLAAGEELYYRCHAAESRTLEINCSDVEVNYNGTVYKAEDGKISIFVEGSIDEPVSFSVKNVGASTVETKIEMVFPLGSRDNPIELTESHNSISLAGEQGIHYKWIATEDGVLTVSKSEKECSMSVYKVKIINDQEIPVYPDVDDAGNAVIEITAGDEIFIQLSNNKKSDISLTLTLEVEAGE